MSHVFENLIFDGVMVPENARINGLNKVDIKNAQDVAYATADRMSVLLSMVAEDEENAPQIGFMASVSEMMLPV